MISLQNSQKPYYFVYGPYLPISWTLPYMQQFDEKISFFAVWKVVMEK